MEWQKPQIKSYSAEEFMQELQLSFFLKNWPGGIDALGALSYEIASGQAPPTLKEKNVTGHAGVGREKSEGAKD
jgi:hypothetical protein